MVSQSFKLSILLFSILIFIFYFILFCLYNYEDESKHQNKSFIWCFEEKKIQIDEFQHHNKSLICCFEKYYELKTNS